MNAGRDLKRARAHAQANADWTGQIWTMHLYNDFWWIDRLSSFGEARQREILAGKTDIEVVRPSAENARRQG